MSPPEAVYVDAGRPLPGLDLFETLNRHLAAEESKVEFYFIGGAILSQAFHAAPGTARVSAMFKPAAVVRRATERVAAEAGVPARWWVDAVREAMLRESRLPTHLDWSHVAVFEPVPAYVLAVKCAALRLDDGERAVDDLRYLLRAMNVRSSDEALGTVRLYFTERQLPPRTSSLLEGLLLEA